MKKKTGVSLFSGGGLVEASLPEVSWVGAVEFDPQIAAHHKVAHPETPITIACVSAVDYSQWAGVDYLHSSPSCKQASTANINKGEAESDTKAAQAVIHSLKVIRPRVFTLENVRGYAKFAAFQDICAALSGMDYRFDFAVYNSANFGTPQTRLRLYLRAWRKEYGPLPDVLPTYASAKALEREGTGSLFEPPLCQWRSWYEAIVDIIPTLKPSKLADWQLRRLPENFAFALINSSNQGNAGVSETPPGSPSVLVRVQGGGGMVIPAHCHSATIIAAHGSAKYRALIVDGQNTVPTADGGRTVSVRSGEEPMLTVPSSVHKGLPKAFLVADQAPYDKDSTVSLRGEAEPAFCAAANPSHQHLALVPGSVVRLSARCLARFQDLPDTYPLPASERLACTIVGNGVAGNLQRAITVPLLEALI